jgi:hypothetical protein
MTDLTDGSEVVNMLLSEWDWDEALEVRAEEAMEKTEAKYQPILAEKDRALETKDRENKALALENEELRRKLREAGIAG